MSKFIALVILCMFANNLAEARLPQVGDSATYRHTSGSEFDIEKIVVTDRFPVRECPEGETHDFQGCTKLTKKNQHFKDQIKDDVIIRTFTDSKFVIPKLVSKVYSPYATRDAIAKTTAAACNSRDLGGGDAYFKKVLSIEWIDTGFGKIETCKIVYTDPQDRRHSWTIWWATEVPFTLVKEINSNGGITELIAYTSQEDLKAISLKRSGCKAGEEHITWNGTVLKCNTKHAALGEAFQDAAGLIWGEAVLTPNGQLEPMYYHEAKRYCESIGARLPTNQELARLRKAFAHKDDSDKFNFATSNGKGLVLPNFDGELNFWGTGVWLVDMYDRQKPRFLAEDPAIFWKLEFQFDQYDPESLQDSNFANYWTIKSDKATSTRCVVQD